MKKNVSKALIALFIMLAAVSFVSAEDYLSANDLQKETVMDVKIIDDIFSVYANEEKAVNFDTGCATHTAEDGEVFNNRIKLNGSGNVDARSIHFVTKGPATVTVYLNSGSKTEARTLVCANVADGAAVANIVAAADIVVGNSYQAGIQSFAVPAAGEYALFSKKSGINVYQIIIE